jgi:branched-chain amino acid transport system substrate-binding protein
MRRFDTNMNRMMRFTIILVISAVIIGLSACEQLIQLLSDGDTSEMHSVPPQLLGVDGEIPIGLVYPETGRLSEFGLPIKRGFELALEEINSAQQGDARIKFIVEDDRSTIEGAVEAYRRLIEKDKVPIIFGPTTSDQAEAAFPIAEQNQVVAFSSSSNRAGLSALGDFLFRAGITTDKLIPGGVRATYAKLNYQRVATIYDEIDPYSIDSHQKFTETLAEKNVEILVTETFQSGETDFSAALNRIMEASPEVIFIAALPPELTKIQVQGRELGISSEVPYITSLISDVENAGAAAEGSISFAGWIATAATPGNQAFVQKYRAKYDSEPNPWTAQSYAAVYILTEAISQAQSTNPSAIRDALANIRDFDTVLGKFSFDDVGDAVYDPVVLIIENGEFKIFE